VAAAFVSDQWRPHPTLLLDAGARIQAAFGHRPYDPLALFSSSLVWNFVPQWHLKANFSQGFRPPVFFNTAANNAAVNLGASANLKNETSNAVQGEVNARVLRNVRAIRELTVRADYSYTKIDNLIVLTNGVYNNAGERGIQSAEFLGRLYLHGDHQIQVGYTFLQIADSLNGAGRFIPNHWFTINAAYSLIPERLELISTLWLASAAEDPNRIPGGTPYSSNNQCDPTMPAKTGLSCGGDAISSNIVVDRLPAIANWNLGARWKGALGIENLELTGFAYNVLDQRFYYHDAFSEPNPQLEFQPYPGAAFSFFANARYRH